MPIAEQAIQALYQSVAERMAMTAMQFEYLLAGWEVIPIEDAGEVIGAAIRKGPELHVGVLRTPASCHRHQYRAVINETIAKHGCAVTAVRVGNRAGLAFCVRLGFEIVQQTGEAFYLRCERCRYA